jgi:hypothetical protein
MLEETALGVAQIGHSVQRNIGDGFAENDMKNEKVVDRALRIAYGFGEGIG